MSEIESQPLNPERVEYDEFFEMVDDYARECSKSAGTGGMPERGYGSSGSQYKILFNQDPWGYKLSIIGNSTSIPLNILGIRDEDVNALDDETAQRIQSAGVYRLDLLITKTRIVVQGKLMDRADQSTKWDPEVSMLSPDTKSVLPLIKSTSHRYKGQSRN